MAAVMPALRAQSFDEALQRFSADSFSDTDAAIGGVAASGNPLAADIVGALQEGRLFFDPEAKRVYIRAADGRTRDAATGNAVNEPSGLKPVRLNNRLRGIVQAALGSLTLLSSDPKKRLDAAQAVFKSRDAAALPALDNALARETDARVKRALSEARAAVVLFSADARETDKIEAVTVLRERGDQEALAILSTLPSGAPAGVQKLAADARSSIEYNLAIWAAVQNAWYGLSLGSVLLLAAIGLAITFGVMGVINMAHGEMVMLGAYTTFVVQELIRAHNPALFDYSLAIAVPLAFLVAGLVGILIERGIIRFLYGRPLETLLATWGISLILQQAVRTYFGPTNKEVGNPTWMSGAFEVGQITVTYNRLWIIVFTLAVFVALLALL
ncbi:MAG: urea ABC transporter permease subunit UrtB, partial [Pseudorhodoplanes sp.]